MKLSPQSLAYILNVVQTASLVKIDRIIIEPNKVRGADEARTIVIFQQDGVPDFDFGSIGLNRTDVLLSRYDIAKGCENVEVEVITDDKAGFARALTFKGKGVKLDYRAANPATLQDATPKQMNDPVKYRIHMNAEAVLLMVRGASAMKTEDVEFVGTPDGVTFKMEDAVNRDMFTCEFATKNDVRSEDGSPVNFAHTYPIKNLLILLKQNPEGHIYLTERKGILKVTVNSLDFYIPPRT